MHEMMKGQSRCEASVGRAKSRNIGPVKAY